MAEAAEPAGESQGAEVQSQRPMEKVLAVPLRRGPSSVLKVSQLLLRAIAAHKGLTLAVLKRELGNAGYQVRRKCSRSSSEAPGTEIKGTFLRVSGSDAAGYFRVWKSPKPKRRPGRPRLEEGVRAPRRAAQVPRSPRRRHARPRAARKAREMWRRSARANVKARKTRPRAKEARGKAMGEGRGRSTKEDIRPRTREEKRPSSKAREEKKQDPEKSGKRTIQKPTSGKTDPTCSGQGKTHDARSARTKTSTKCEGPRNAAWNP